MSQPEYQHSWFSKIAWSLGSTGAAVSNEAVAMLGYFFYVDYLGMAPKLAGIAWVIFSVWNAINDPLLGQLSDRTRSRWGRRVPYILGGTLPLAAAFVLLWMPKMLHVPVQYLFLYYVAALCLFDGLYTLVVLNWTALYPEMYTSVRERAQVGVMRQILAIVGLFIAFVVPPMLYGMKPDGSGWVIMGVALGGVTALTLFISVLGSRERPEFEGDKPLGFWASLSATWRNRSFLTFGVANMAINFSYGLLAMVYPFFAKYVLRVQGFQQSVLLAAIFVVALIVMPVWGRILVANGPRRTLTIAACVFGLATIPFLFASDFISGMAASLLIGMGFSGLLLVPDVLLADIIDEDELKTGRRREGVYFGINGFFVRIAIAAQAGALALVQMTTGYDSRLAVQTAKAVTGLRILMSPVVIAALLLVALMLSAYPLYGTRLDQVKADLSRLHENKAQRSM